MIRKLLAGLFVLMLIPAWIGCGGLPRSAVAQVSDGGKDKVITREDLDKAIEELKQQYSGSIPEPGTPEYITIQKQVAERLVNEEILWFEADKMGITVSDEEINTQVDQYKQSTGGDEQFNAKLSENNMTLDALKERIRKNLLFQKLYPEVTKDAPQITDEQALKYYNENPTQFQTGETRKVKHILVKDEATANAVVARLNAGEDFAVIAKEVSIDPGTKDKGGDLGDVPSTGSGFVAEFETAMKALAAGQTSAPVKTQFGYHIIRVETITPAKQKTFEESKEDIKQGLYMENQRTAFEAWFESVKGNYTVVYADEFKPDATTATQPQTGAQTQATPAQ
ncbi:MAG: peptidyl-prolyl cis-trans isomerase [Thermoleophilia bacterium]|jgi:foldase protein PrsA